MTVTRAWLLTLAIPMMLAMPARAQDGPSDSAAQVAAAAPFAALTVTPAGRQIYDITTGITTLPDGGSVIDQDTGVRLDATELSYVDGSYIEANGATVEGTFGRVQAASVRIDVAKGTLSVPGETSLTRDGLTITAAALQYDASAQVAEFTGPVVGDQPSFHATGLLLDARTGDVLLVGPYSYQAGPITLTSPTHGGRLQLTFHDVDGRPVYDATTEVSKELLERFAGRLP